MKERKREREKERKKESELTGRLVSRNESHGVINSHWGLSILTISIVSLASCLHVVTVKLHEDALMWEAGKVTRNSMNDDFLVLKGKALLGFITPPEQRTITANIKSNNNKFGNIQQQVSKSD
jgi:hypothetical protein